MQKYRSILRSLIPVLLAISTFGLTEMAANHPETTEDIYSKGVYPFVASVLSRVSAVFPFSLDDLLYIFLILGFLTLTVLLFLRKATIKRYFLLLVNILSVVYILFYWLWGFNYFREHLNSRLDIPEQKASTEKFRSALDILINSANTNHVDTFSLKKDEINSLIEDSYKDMSHFLEIDYPQGVRRPKNITFSKLFAKATISGYFGPFFNEIHINKYLLPVEYPWTLAHEKSHQFGITSEAEANFYAWLVCNNSSNKQIRYAGNLNLLFYFLYDARKLNDYQDIVNSLDESVRNDIKKIIAHWSTLRNRHIEKVAEKANDTYLKTNKVEKGIDDYDGVVRFVTEFLSMQNGN